MEQYIKVKVKNNNYEKDWVKKWDVGYIIEIYDNNNYEVEFSDPTTWIDFAQTVIKWEDLEEIE
jgi:ATP-dependent exoDNAse (exonuclease V) alpha subunit